MKKRISTATGIQNGKCITKLVLFLSLSMILFIGIQVQPAYAFTPTNIGITPNPTNIVCDQAGGKTGVVTVVITGTLTTTQHK